MVTEPLRVGDPIDGLLEGQRQPGDAEDCGKQMHRWHLLSEPKFSAYCALCGKKRRRVKLKQ